MLTHPACTSCQCNTHRLLPVLCCLWAPFGSSISPSATTVLLGICSDPNMSMQKLCYIYNLTKHLAGKQDKHVCTHVHPLSLQTEHCIMIMLFPSLDPQAPIASWASNPLNAHLSAQRAAAACQPASHTTPAAKSNLTQVRTTSHFATFYITHCTESWLPSTPMIVMYASKNSCCLFCQCST